MPYIKYFTKNKTENIHFSYISFLKQWFDNTDLQVTLAISFVGSPRYFLAVSVAKYIIMYALLCVLAICVTRVVTERTFGGSLVPAMIRRRRVQATSAMSDARP